MYSSFKDLSYKNNQRFDRVIKDKTQNSASIFNAIYKADIDGVRRILKISKQNLFNINEKNNTPLEFALIYRQFDIAKYLILKGALLDERVERLITKNVSLDIDEFKEISRLSKSNDTADLQKSSLLEIELTGVDANEDLSLNESTDHSGSCTIL